MGKHAERELACLPALETERLPALRESKKGDDAGRFFKAIISLKFKASILENAGWITIF